VALALANWAGFYDFYLVANVGFVVFVVRHKLLAYGVLLAVQRVGLALTHSYHDSLVDLAAAHSPDN
jgi:hypothetical protein